MGDFIGSTLFFVVMLACVALPLVGAGVVVALVLWGKSNRRSGSPPAKVWDRRRVITLLAGAGGLAVLALGAGGVSLYLAQRPPKPVATVEAGQLYREFLANTAAYDSKYKGKAVELKGIVFGVDRADSGDYLVYLYVTAAATERARDAAVSATFGRGHAAALGGLRHGDRCAVIGVCGDPIPAGGGNWIIPLSHCRLAQP